MSANHDNPCATCSIDQDCCTHLSGLRVTEAEFQRCFSSHVDLLHIEREGPVLVLTPKDGAACPNWQKGGCAVYDDRPRECRLFPFTLFVRKQGADLVSIGYHSDTRCPLKQALIAPDAEARAIVANFGEEAFPRSKLEVSRETTLERLRRRTAAAAWRLLSIIRKTSF